MGKQEKQKKRKLIGRKTERTARMRVYDTSGDAGLFTVYIMETKTVGEDTARDRVQDLCFIPSVSQKSVCPHVAVIKSLVLRCSLTIYYPSIQHLEKLSSVAVYR